MECVAGHAITCAQNGYVAVLAGAARAQRVAGVACVIRWNGKAGNCSATSHGLHNRICAARHFCARLSLRLLEALDPDRNG